MVRQPAIAFENLRAEMARENVNVKDMAECWGCNRDTAARKLARKSPVMLEEAFKAQRRFFPNRSVQFLFSEIV